MRSLLVCAALASAGAQSLYNFEESSIVQLDDENFHSVMTADTNHMWVVEYYADWCGHCKAFASGYQKAATNLKGLVRFGAVNGDTAKKTQGEAGVQGFPSVKVYLPEVMPQI